MAYTARELITRSYFLSGIVSRQLQVPTGDQISVGLELLNSMLDFKQIETELIPYWTYIGFNSTASEEYYYMPNVADLELSTFNLNVVRYPMSEVSRRSYYGSGRVDNIAALPFNYNFNRGENGGTLAIYFLPESNFPLKMMVKLFLSDVTDLDQDLRNVFAPLGSGFVSTITITAGGTGYTSSPTVTITGLGMGAEAFANISNGAVSSISIVNAGSGYASGATVVITGGGGTGATATAAVSSYTFLQSSNAGFDNSYLEYLRCELSAYLCEEYGLQLSPQAAKRLTSYRRTLMYISPPDLSMIKTTILAADANTGYNWGDVNIGMGWRV